MCIVSLMTLCRPTVFLCVQVNDMRDPPRMAHVIVHVEILDVNDNVPVFVHHLFNAIVQVDANIGEVVRQVK